MMRAALVAFTAWGLAAPAVAQQPRDVAAGQRTGTASVSGVIVSDDAQRKPLRRARVMLNGDALDLGRTAITHDDGSFVFDRLPPGRYALSATKDGYVTQSYGARRPNRPGPGFALRVGDSLRLTMTLPRGAVLTGTITGPEGLPAEGVRVLALAYRYVRGPDERMLMPLGTAAPQTTDDRGVFRIFGLPPGDYLLGALPHAGPVQLNAEVELLSESELRRALTDVRRGGTSPGPSNPGSAIVGAVEKRRTVGMVPVYFPGTTVLARAAAITLSTGEERTGLDFQLQYVPTAIVQGTVALPPGAVGASVMLFPSERGAPPEGTRSGRVGSDGRFAIRSVPPGEYRLVARSSMPAVRTSTSPPGALPPVGLFASTDIQVDGDNSPEIFLHLQPGLTLTGTVLFDGAPAPPVALPPVRLNTPLMQSGTYAAFGIPPVQIDSEGRFTVTGIPPGSYRMMANLQGLRSPVGRWWLKSFVVDGRELLDAGLDLRQSSSNAVLRFSTRAGTLTGTAKDGAGNPATDAHVIVFSTSQSTWFANSRRIATVRPAAADGRFTIRNLPPGEYFILAEEDVEPGEWFDALFLERLVAQATRITLAEDEQKTHDIIIGAR